MSFLVDLRPAAGPPGDLSALEAALPAGSPAERDGETLVYEADHTGVTFRITRSEEGFSAALPLAVPMFFGEEAARVLVPAARRLSCLVSVEGRPPEEPDEERVVAHWRDANRRAGESEWRAQQGRLAWLPEERLTEWWRWQSELAERQIRDVIFTPQILLLLDLRDGSVKTSATWPDLGPVTLPTVDLVHVAWRMKFEKRKRGGLLFKGRRVEVKEKEAGGYLPFGIVRPFFERAGRRVEGSPACYRYEGGADPIAALDEDELLSPAVFKPLHPSQILDVRP